MRFRIIFLLIFFTMFNCLAKEKNIDIKKEEIVPVGVTKVKLTDLEEILEYVGSIKAEDEVVIYPKVTGKIIEKVKDIGDEVKKDDVIAYIDRDEVGFEFQKAPVLSTLDGFIGKIYVDIGQRVNTQSPIALVINMDRVKINLEIPEKYISKVSLGQIAKIGVDAYPNEEFIGKVNRISPVVDVVSRVFLIEIVVDNPKHLLKSGMFARIKLILNTYKDSKIILKEAIIRKDNQDYVYVVEDNKAVLKKIDLGLKSGPYYQVLDGLKENDKVVILGKEKLFNGCKVKAEEMNNF